MTTSTRSHAKKASFVALVLCAAVVALYSLGRPAPSCPALHQQPDSISLRFRGLGSDRFVWLSKSGESTSCEYHDGKFSGLRRGKLTEAQWIALCSALPDGFFQDTKEHWAESTTSDVAYEEYSTGVSVSLAGKYRTVWIHPSHFSHGLLKPFREEVGSASESLPFVDGIDQAYALGVASPDSRLEEPDPAQAATFEQAVKTPGRWYPNAAPTHDGNYKMDGCGYWLVTGAVFKRSWEHGHLKK